MVCCLHVVAAFSQSSSWFLGDRLSRKNGEHFSIIDGPQAQVQSFFGQSALGGVPIGAFQWALDQRQAIGCVAVLTDHLET